MQLNCWQILLTRLDIFERGVTCCPQTSDVCLSIASCSATWPEDVRRLAASYMKNPMQVFVGTLDLTVNIVIPKQVSQN